MKRAPKSPPWKPDMGKRVWFCDVCGQQFPEQFVQPWHCSRSTRLVIPGTITQKDGVWVADEPQADMFK